MKIRLVILLVLVFVVLLALIQFSGTKGHLRVVAIPSSETKYFYYAVEGNIALRIGNIIGYEIGYEYATYCVFSETLVFFDDLKNIWRVQIGGNPQKIFDSGSSMPSSLSWSGDCSHIAFLSHDKRETPQVYLMDADGGNINQITTDDFYKTIVALAPDGKKLAYATSYGEKTITTIVDLVTQKEQAQLLDGITMYALRWSPDGTKIAVSYYSPIDNLTIWVLRTDNLETVLKRNCADNPVWSPDSESIAYVDYCDHNGEIYVTQIDSGTPRKLTDSYHMKSQLMWVDHHIIVVSYAMVGEASTTWQIDEVNEDGSDPKVLASYEGQHQTSIFRQFYDEGVRQVQKLFPTPTPGSTP